MRPVYSASAKRLYSACEKHKQKERKEVAPSQLSRATLGPRGGRKRGATDDLPDAALALLLARLGHRVRLAVLLANDLARARQGLLARLRGGGGGVRAAHERHMYALKQRGRAKDVQRGGAHCRWEREREEETEGQHRDGCALRGCAREGPGRGARGGGRGKSEVLNWGENEKEGGKRTGKAVAI